MRRLPAFAALALLIAAPARADPRADWARVSDWGRTGIGVVAFGLPALSGDGRGARQSLLAMGGASIATGVLKYATHERRPDGSDRHSFPSGHTSLSFAAAAGLDQRYGLKAGIPAHLIAGLVGLARVKADKHYWHDVAVGALIGEVTGRMMVARRRDRRASPPLALSIRLAF